MCVGGGGDCELTLGQETLVHKAWDDVRVLKVVIVVRSKDVGGNGAGELVSVLVVVCAATIQELVVQATSMVIETRSLVEHVDQTFAMSIAKIAAVRRTIVHLTLVNGVADLVGKDCNPST